MWKTYINIFHNRCFVSCIGERNVCVSYFRLFSTEKKIIVKIDDDHAFGKKYTIKKLEELLKIRTFAALDIANKHKKLSLVNGKMMTKSFQLLQDAGVTIETILKYPLILADREIEMKITLLRLLPYDINVVAAFFYFDSKNLANFVQKEKREGRIARFSKALQVS